MVQVPYNGNITNHLRKSHHVQQETETGQASRKWNAEELSPFVKPSFGHIFLLYGPFSNLHWSNDRFSQGLSVFLLYKGLYARSIYIFRRRIILLILV
jgi:hypothetical protein